MASAALAELSALVAPEALEQWRIAYLGRRGSLTTVLRGLSGLDIEERRRIGALANQAKESLESGLEARSREINEAACSAPPAKTVSMSPSPAARPPRAVYTPPPR